MNRVVIVDYGLGNLFNVQRMLESLNVKSVLSDKPEVIRNADRLILPGVGAFGEGMAGLNTRGLSEPIKEFAKSGKPTFGICLGMQLMLSSSNELGTFEGLGLVKGECVRFQDPTPESFEFKVPHIGWNTLLTASARTWQKTVLQGLDKSSFMYFVHSYVCVPANADHVLAQTEYGNQRFCSAFQTENLMGCQGHPERSAETGVQIFKNFLSI